MNKTISPENDKVNVRNVSPNDQMDSRRNKEAQCQRKALKKIASEATNFELRGPRI